MRWRGASTVALLVSVDAVFACGGAAGRSHQVEADEALEAGVAPVALGRASVSDGSRFFVFELAAEGLGARQGAAASDDDECGQERAPKLHELVAHAATDCPPSHSQHQ